MFLSNKFNRIFQKKFPVFSWYSVIQEVKLIDSDIISSYVIVSKNMFWYYFLISVIFESSLLDFETGWNAYFHTILPRSPPPYVFLFFALKLMHSFNQSFLTFPKYQKQNFWTKFEFKLSTLPHFWKSLRNWSESFSCKIYELLNTQK